MARTWSPNKKTILIYSDSPTAHTGFGNVVRSLGYRLRNKYNLGFLGINSNGDPLPETQDFHIFPPNRGDIRGRDRIHELLIGTNADILFTLNDYDAVLEVPKYLSEARQQLNKNIPWVHYFPVVTTDWGANVIKKSDPGLDVPVIYHGVDSGLFAPLDPEIRTKERTESGFNDKFVVLMVGMNQIRKQYGTALQAFAEFSKDKDDVLLLLHTSKHTVQGWDIPTVVRRLHMQYEEKGFVHIPCFHKVCLGF